MSQILFMNKPSFFLSSIAIFFLFLPAYSQQNSDSTSRTLETVIIKAYEGNRRLKEVPASVNYISSLQLNRNDNTNILTAVNSTPGVIMEERSPGSYRLNIRGSSLRSPFGVRNVKVYWNEIPFTDPGGNTYLNQFNIHNIQTIEIIKGPSGSMYGAGTGGAMLINQNVPVSPNGIVANFIAGSFNLTDVNIQTQGGSNKFSNSISIGRLHKDGYRLHTEMRRDVATWQMQLQTSAKNKLRLNFLYGDLYYQTPGGLTKTEYTSNPKSFRPAAGAFPSAEGAKAAIYQKMFLGGLSNHYQINKEWNNTTVLYAAYTDLKNPTFRNYEARQEPHYGGRTVFKWSPSSLHNKTVFVFGGEMQRGNFNIKTSRNKNGAADSLLTNDDVKNNNMLLFTQADFSLKNDLNIVLGAGVSRFKVGITRQNVTTPKEQSRIYKNEISPRLAISKKIFMDFRLYASVSRGFSPPTVAEVLPSNSVISTMLNAEHGISYESGIKATWLNNKLYTEINIFYYQLKDAIVQRRDANNADYFLNAGKTKQKGIESQVQYSFIRDDSKVINNLSLKVSHTLYDFIYGDFKQLTNDYTNKNLPGVPKNTITALLDIGTKAGAYINLTYYYGDKVALNDANTVYAGSYNLLGTRIGWKNNKTVKLNIELFAGADNLFDIQYSPGNDINAAGGRYFNAATGINFYGGIIAHFGKKSKLI